MEYGHIMKDTKHKMVWQHSFSNELGILAQFVGNRVKVIDTIFFVEYEYFPSDIRKYITFVRIVVYYRPQTEEPNRARLTVGVNLIDFPGYMSTPTADTTTDKIVWNSVVSTYKARYMCIDINIFLGYNTDQVRLYPHSHHLNPRRDYSEI